MNHDQKSRRRPRGDERQELVDTYLTQIGELPLLSQSQEQDLVKRIDRIRLHLRRQMLRCDHVAGSIIKLLQKVQNGEAPFTQYIRPSFGHSKHKIERRILENVQSVDRLLAENGLDYQKAMSRRRPLPQRREAWKRLGLRRGQIVRLLEQLCVRQHAIEQLLPELEKMSHEADRLAEIVRRRVPVGGGRQSLRTAKARLRQILLATRETASSLRRRTLRAKEDLTNYRQMKNELCRHNLRLVVYVAKRYQRPLGLGRDTTDNRIVGDVQEPRDMTAGFVSQPPETPQ